MKIFISYAREHRRDADAISIALRQESHRVFFDRDALRASESFHATIRQNILESDLLIFLIAPESVEPTGYAISELDFARRKWPNPHGHVLPVLIRPTPVSQIPEYLKAVTFVDPAGDPTASVVAQVADLAKRKNSRRVRTVVMALLLVAATTGTIAYLARTSHLPTSALSSQDDRINLQLARRLLDEPIYFHTNHATYSATNDALLERKARVLKSNPSIRLTLAANADVFGSREYRIGIGQREADVVKRALVKRGVDGEQIETMSFGKEKPVDPKWTTRSDWDPNRRVDFITKGAISSVPENMFVLWRSDDDVKVIQTEKQLQVRLERDTRVLTNLFDESGRLILGRQPLWISEDPGVASIDENGFVKARTLGKTSFRTTVGSVSTSIEVLANSGRMLYEQETGWLLRGCKKVEVDQKVFVLPSRPNQCVLQIKAAGIASGHYAISGDVGLASFKSVAGIAFGMDESARNFYLLQLPETSLLQVVNGQARVLVPGTRIDTEPPHDAERADLHVDVDVNNSLITYSSLIVGPIKYVLPSPAKGRVGIVWPGTKEISVGGVTVEQLTDPIN